MNKVLRFPAGVELECGKCGALKHVSSSDAVSYIVSGWPKHCGQTMKLNTNSFSESSGSAETT